MPELPDVAIYVEALEKRILGQRLENLRIVSPFLLRSVDPPVGDAIGKRVVELRRVGKRIWIGLGEDESRENQETLAASRTTDLLRVTASDARQTEKAASSRRTPKSAEIWLVLHLMIAGRLHWGKKATKLSKQHLGAFDFENGSLLWMEAGSQKRASLYLARGE